MQEKRVAILFSGRGSNLDAILKQEQSGFFANICNFPLCISNKETANGVLIAQKYMKYCKIIPSQHTTKKEFELELLRVLLDYNIDYIVLAGFLKILSPEFLRFYEEKIINIHPANTHEHQGLHGYKWAWDSNKPSTQITIHIVEDKLDAGRILAQETLSLANYNSLFEVEQAGLKIEHVLYSKIIRNYIATRE